MAASIATANATAADGKQGPNHFDLLVIGAGSGMFVCPPAPSVWLQS